MVIVTAGNVPLNIVVTISKKVSIFWGQSSYSPDKTYRGGFFVTISNSRIFFPV